MKYLIGFCILALTLTGCTNITSVDGPSTDLPMDSSEVSARIDETDFPEMHPSGTTPKGIFSLPERFAKFIPELNPNFFYTETAWVDIKGHFLSATQNETVSFFLFHDSDSDETPRYFAFFQSGNEIRYTEFSESNPLRIVDILVCDLTGDELDEVIVKQYDTGTVGTGQSYSLYVIAANAPRPLFLYDGGHYSSSSYDFGFSGIVTADMTAVISNEFTETDTVLDLSGYVNTSESDESFHEKFTFLLLQNFSISSVKETQNEIIFTGEVWLEYRDGDSYIDESIAKTATHLLYDEVKKAFIITEVEITPRLG